MNPQHSCKVWTKLRKYLTEIQEKEKPIRQVGETHAEVEKKIEIPIPCQKKPK